MDCELFVLKNNTAAVENQDWLVSNPCLVEWFNIFIFGSYVYSIILMIICLRWSTKSHFRTARKKFVGHCERYTLLLILLLLHLAEFGDYVLSSLPLWHYYILTPLSAISVNLLVQILYAQAEKQEKIEYLFVTLIFWLICGLVRALQFLTVIHQHIDRNYVRFFTALSTCLLSYSIAINDSFTIYKHIIKKKNNNEREEGDKEDCPNGVYQYHYSCWYSRVTFYWIIPLLHLTHLTRLQLHHLGQLPPCETASVQYKKFSEIYDSQKKKAMPYNTSTVCLWKCYFHGYWKPFALGGFLKLLGDITGLLPPIGVSIIVKYVESYQNPQPSNSSIMSYTTMHDFLNNGFVMAFIVLVATFAQGSLSQGSTHFINVQGIRLKTALQAKIYWKTLKIRKSHVFKSGNSNDNFDGITSLISEDVNNIMSCFWIGNYVWAIPLKITLIIWMLYWKMGISAVIGCVMCIIIMIPLQFIVGKKMSSNSKFTTEWTDKRIRTMNEVLQGIRFLKVSCWEVDFSDKILKQRQNELKHLNRDSTYWAILTFLTNACSVIMALLALVFHYWISKSTLDVGTLFTCLALFNQLTVPLFIFPIMVPLVISAVTSTRRLEKFFSLPEINGSTFRNNDTSNRNSSNADDNIGKNDLHSFNMNQIAKNEDDANSRLRKITENSENEEASIENNSPSPYIKTSSLSSEKTPMVETVVEINKAIFSWFGDSLSSSLVVENLIISKGTMNAIIGDVGSGKSSLFSALLGEMQIYSGKIIWNRNIQVAYVAQMTWLLNTTVKENILFGRAFREKRFRRILSDCCLQCDIDSFPDKEHTIVGERGIMISGGQRQRIAIARALYSKADIIFMDDPLSALDSKVADHIFENGIKKYITKGTNTIVLITNSKKLLSHANQIIVMKDGCMKAVGNLPEVCKLASEEISNWTAKLAPAPLSETNCDNNYSSRLKFCNSECSGPISFVPLKRRLSTFSGSRYFTHDLPLPTDDCDAEVFTHETVIPKRHRTRAATVAECPSTSHKTVFRASSLQTNRNNSVNSTLRGLLEPGAKHTPFELRSSVKRNNQSTSSAYTESCSELLLEEEEEKDVIWEMKDPIGVRGESGVKFGRQLLYYMKACGSALVVFYLIVTFAWQAVRVCTDFWLSYIITHHHHTSSQLLILSQMKWNLFVYAMLSFGAVLLSFMSTATGQYAGAISRKFLHDNMLINILRCPLSFFEITPLGQIIHRFSNDVDTIDKKIATSIQRLIQFQLLCLSAIVVNSVITPWFVVLVIPISLVYYMVQKFYRRTSRDLQRLENILKTPILSQISETTSGIQTIRAYGQEKRFLYMMYRTLDSHTNIFLALNSVHRWLGITLDYLGGLIVFLAMLVSLISVMLYPKTTSPAFVGLAVNYTLLVPIYFNWVVKFLVDLETYLSAVERIDSYTKMPTENYHNDAIVPRGWPNETAIKFENVTLQYMPQSKPVIQNLNLYIPHGQKVGICGRTGSGKSSLMLSLFSMVNRIEGVIYIDGVDIDSIPLQTLRSSLSIIPQDVIMFSGTIRENMDLRHEYSDKEIWRALKIVHMEQTVLNLGGLDTKVQDGGLNLSCGERQMISLARAVLYDSKCLILDEATSSLQFEAEKEFLRIATLGLFQSTILVITHRVSSLMEFDRILVLERGMLVEDGSPKELAVTPDGIFSSLLKLSTDG